ncbi:allantoinase [Paenibacillus radicis (ex Gao et al. 2016)]|uniref:Allantoinase n=1 Tax=Paenibacillus radicis (ex Gao et al. 2016) TaxID=1737354 RepID=A0A917M632_9BACL|nr:allantoinase [Paenibacillus radicis (ex Gao et al. 2016)]GGG79647.1 allantoinase [Paenibacillus radicis (ex Gao et al. 2016)]
MMNGPFDRIVKNGTVVLPGGTRKLDIGIADGKIAALSESLASSEPWAGQVMDAEGCYVLPGMIDIHVHFNEPGLHDWEGFESGSASLAAGGITSYADMPLNGNPPTVTPDVLRLKQERAAQSSVVDYLFWGGLMPGKLDQLEAMSKAGVIGFKAFMSSPGGEGESRFRETDDWTLLEGMKRIAKLGGFVALHAESDSITAHLAAEAVAAGRLDARAFIASRPPIAELEAVNKALLFAEITGCPLHFVHISTVEAVEMIVRAKANGLEVTVETCPHYLYFTEEDMAEQGPVAKCAPPLRTVEQKEGLWRLIAEGKLDIIASDHSPCPPELKFGQDRSFFDVWGGISGAQSSMELILHEGWIKRGIAIDKLSALMSAGPAKRFGLYPQKGAIAIGSDADLAIIHPDHPYTLRDADLFYRHKHSPYSGKQFNCKVAATLVRGELVYVEGQGVKGGFRGRGLMSG